MIESKIGQRLVGLLLLTVGGGVTAWSWYTALNEGYYYRAAVVFFPAFAVFGIGMLLFPIDMERLRAEYGVDKPQKFDDYPPTWKVMFVVALLASLCNWLAISRW